MPRERHSPTKRIVLANPEEPKAGEFSYILYDNANPDGGDSETQDRFRTALHGLRGHEVLMKIRGERRDAEGRFARFTAKTTFTYNRLSDVFGAGSAYSNAMHSVQDDYSSDELVTVSVEFESLED